MVHEALGDALAQLQRRFGVVAVFVVDGRGGQVVVVGIAAAVVQDGPDEFYSVN